VTDPLVAELRRALEDRNVVLVVGSGVSVSTTARNDPCASWAGLLSNGVEYTAQVLHRPDPWARATRAMVEAGTTEMLLAAADLITSELTGDGRDLGNMKAWLRQSVGALKREDPRLLETLASFDLPIATTNYDSLIEEATGRRPAIWTDVDDVQAFLAWGEDCPVLHVHGHWERPDTVLLGRRSYHDQESSQLAEGMMHALALQRVLVFVGCGEGLGDPHFSRVLTWMRGALKDSAHRHYVLLPTAEVERATEAHKGEPVWFVPYGAHADLVDFLAHLPGARTRPGPSREAGRAPGNGPVPSPKPPEHVVLTLSIGADTVNASLSGQDQLASSRLRLSLGSRHVARTLIERLRTDRIAELWEIEALGAILYDAVFGDEARALLELGLTRRPDGGVLQLELRFDDDELRQYPWEFLFGRMPPSARPEFLAMMYEIVVTRRVAEDEKEVVLARERPRLLVVTPGPSSLREAAGGQEHDLIAGRILARNDLDPLDPVSDASAEGLIAMLHAARPDVVHYVGYGSDREGGQIALRPRGRGGWSSYREFIDCFNEAGYRPPLVVLHLCPDATGGPSPGSGSFGELAYELSASRVPAVVGTQGPVSNEHDQGHGFTKAFYDKILKTGSVSAAVQASRRAALAGPAIWTMGKHLLCLSGREVASAVREEPAPELRSRPVERQEPSSQATGSWGAAGGGPPRTGADDLAGRAGASRDRPTLRPALPAYEPPPRRPDVPL
jgi:hypothetical protein